MKGSLVDRKVKGKTKPSTTLKDVNYLLAAESSPNFINLQDEKKKHLATVVRKDVNFLSGLGLMDYSMLLAIETLDDSQRVMRGDSV